MQLLPYQSLVILYMNLYTMKSLKIISKKFKLNLYSNGKTVHLLTNKSLSPFLFSILCRSKVALILNYVIRKRSLTTKDYEKVSSEN